MSLRRPLPVGNSASQDSWDEESSDDDTPCKRALLDALKPSESTGPEPLDGNIYKFFAFISFGIKKHHHAAGGALFTPPEDWFNFSVIIVGLCMCVLIQVLAPIAILLSSLSELNIDPGACWKYGTIQWFVVLLAWAFLFCFILCAYNQVSRDMVTCRKVCRLARALEHAGQPVWKGFLVLDAAVNSYNAVLLSVCMFTILFTAETATDVVFDAFSTAFLMEIDDLASAYGFLGTVWDPQKVGIFYDGMIKNGVFREAGIPMSDDEDDEERGFAPAQLTSGGNESNIATLAIQKSVHAIDDALFTIPARIYKVAQVLLVILLLLAFPSPLIFASNAEHTEINTTVTVA